MGAPGDDDSMVQLVQLGLAGGLGVDSAVVEGEGGRGGVHGDRHGPLGHQGLHQGFLTALHLHIFGLPPSEIRWTGHFVTV